MAKMNLIFVVAISIVALVALAGMASAYSVNVDRLQRNGYYVGTPTLISGGTEQYGYTYTFTPDGTYTLFGTATNDGSTPLTVFVDLSDGMQSVDLKELTVPAAVNNQSGTTTFTLTAKTPWFFKYWTTPADQDDHITLDVLHHYDIVDQGDSVTHTVDQGPMSNLVAILLNGKFNFGNSTLYSFV